MGIVGAGQIVENAHLPVLLNLPGANVCWITDANPHRAAVVSSMYGVPSRAADGLPALLSEVDVCLLATPVGARARYVDLCAEAGKAVLAEKPFATTEAAHRSYCDRFPAHALGVSFQRRFYASITAIRAIVEGRHFGDLQSVSFAIGGFDLKSGGPTRYLGDPRLSGGGVVMDLGIHVLDQILHVTGATDVEVRAVQSIFLDGLDFDAIIEGALHLDRRRIRVRGQVTRLRPIANELEFEFENGVVRFGSDPDATLTFVPRNSGVPLRLEPRVEGSTTVAQAFFQLWSTFIRGLHGQATTPASATTSVLTTRWVDKIYERMGGA